MGGYRYSLVLFAEIETDAKLAQGGNRATIARLSLDLSLDALIIPLTTIRMPTKSAPKSLMIRGATLWLRDFWDIKNRRFWGGGKG